MACDDVLTGQVIQPRAPQGPGRPPPPHFLLQIISSFLLLLDQSSEPPDGENRRKKGGVPTPSPCFRLKFALVISKKSF